VLNSVRTNAESIQKNVRNSKVSYLADTATLLKEHTDDISKFLTTTEQGKKLPAFLSILSEELITEQARYLKALKTLTKHIKHMADIIHLQQSYSKTSGLIEPASIIELVEDSIQINAQSLKRHNVKVKRAFTKLPPFLIDSHKVLQILTNLISNAKYAMSDNNRNDKILTIRITEPQDERFRIEVHDNGTGITKENLTRIFEHGFTTKKNGFGFGLHSAAIAANEMNGSLSAHSDGPGKGTVLILELPFQTKEAEK
jgi:signal transduction histidine kinase